MHYLFSPSKTGLLKYLLMYWSVLNNPQKCLGLHTKATGVKLLPHYKKKKKKNYRYRQAKGAACGLQLLPKGLILMLRDKVLTGQYVTGQCIWSYEILLAINTVHFTLCFPKDWII